MAPLHHHFEMKAWSETKIMVRFWIVTAILCAAGFALFYKYYPQHPRRSESARLRPRAVRALGRRAAARARRRGRARRPLARQRGRPRRCSTASTLVVKSPGRAGRARRSCARRASAGSRSGRRSSSATGCCPGARFVGVTGTNGKTTTTELLGAIFRAAGRDVAVAGNVGTPLTSVARGGLGRLRAVVVPARGRARARVRRRGAAQPRARPPRPARLVRGLPRREAAHLRARAREGRAARARARRDRVLGRRPAAGRAAAPRRAQPRERGRRDRRRARGRDRRRRDRRRRCARFPACRTGSSSSASATACATSTTRRRRTSPPRCRALAAYADEPVHLILGGSLQGRGLRAARRGDRPERPLDPPDRRRGASGSRPRVPARARRRRRSSAPSRTRRQPPSRATSSCSAPPARATTSSRTSRSAARRSASSSGRARRAEPGLGLRDTSRSEVTDEAGRARVEDADPRHAGAGRVRARDGLQRDLRVGGGRRQRPELLPRSARASTRRSGSC